MIIKCSRINLKDDKDVAGLFSTGKTLPSLGALMENAWSDSHDL